MRRWRRFLAWIDRDIGEQGWPSTNSLASNVPVLPYVLVLPPLWYFDPPATIRYWIVGTASVPVAFLFGVWGWRLFVAGRRQIRDLRNARR